MVVSRARPLAAERARLSHQEVSHRAVAHQDRRWRRSRLDDDGVVDRTTGLSTDHHLASRSGFVVNVSLSKGLCLGPGQYHLAVAGGCAAMRRLTSLLRDGCAP